MPKEKFALNKFEGGLVTEIDKRDLPIGASPQMRGVAVGKKGQLRIAGQANKIPQFTHGNIGTITAGFTQGYGLHTFGADYGINSYDSDYFEYFIPIHQVDATGTIATVYCGLKHGLGLNSKFQWVGDPSDTDAFGGEYRATEIVSPYIFKFEASSNPNDITPTIDLSSTTTINDDMVASQNTVPTTAVQNFKVGDLIAIDESQSTSIDGNEDSMLVIGITDDNGNNYPDATGTGDLTVIRFFSATAGTTQTYTSGRTIYKAQYQRALFRKSDYISNHRRFIVMQDKEKFGIIADHGQINDIIDLGTDTSNVQPEFFDDFGALRVVDSNLSNVNNARQTFRYFKPAEFFHYDNPNIYGGDFTAPSMSSTNRGTISGESSDATTENDDSSMEYTFTCTQNSTGGFALAVSEDLGAMVADTIYTVTFDLTVTAGAPPVFYLADTNVITADLKLAASNRLTHIYPSYPGENCVHMNIKVATGSTSFLCFWTERDNEAGSDNPTYTVNNLRFRKGRSGIQRGWFSTSSSIDAPTESNTNHNNDTVSTPAAGTDGPKLYFALNAHEDDVTGDWYFTSTHNYTRWGYTYLYDDIDLHPQESLIHDMGVWEPDTDAVDTDSLKGQIGIFCDINNPRIVGMRIYMTGASDIASDVPKEEDALFFGTIDFRKTEGLTLFDGRKFPWTVNSTSQSSLITFTNIKQVPEGITYKMMAADGWYNWDEKTLDVHYKTSVIANGKCYVGNVRHDTDGDGSVEYYNDKILVSPPFRYDVFPASVQFPLAPDGEDIVKLAEINDKLLIFKQQKIYVVFLGEEQEQLEGEYDGMGVTHPGYVAKTPNGIVWANAGGCWFYDGKELKNLIAGKLSREHWSNFTNNEGALIGYSQVDKAILCVNGYTAYAYDTEADNWSHITFPSGPFISNFAHWHWDSGVIFLDTARLIVDEIVDVTQTQAHVIPQRAAGSFSFTGGTITSAIFEWADSNNTERAATPTITNESGNISTVGSALAMHINAFESPYALNATTDVESLHGHMDPDLGEIDDQATVFVNLTSRHYGNLYNSTASGSNAFFFGSAGNTDSLTGFNVISPLAGGVNPSPGIITFTPNRNGETLAGTTYMIYWGIDLINFWHGSYTVGFGEDADAIATGLYNSIIASTNSSGELIDTISTVTNPSGYVQIAEKIIEPGTNTTDYLIESTGEHIYKSGYHNVNNSGIWGGAVTQFDESARLMSIKPLITSNLGEDVSQSEYFEYCTKDFDFGTPGIRKKVYKAYVTYRCSGNSNVRVQFFTNGKSLKTSNAKTFSASTSTNYTDSSLDNSSNEWAIAELKPSTTSDMNNIYSIALRFISVGPVSSTFGVNDITFIYRTKSVK